MDGRSDEQQVQDSEMFAQEALSGSMSMLSPEETKTLSKVLFPDTHTCEVLVLKKIRKVSPLTLKRSKLMYSALEPVAKIAGDAIANADATVSLNDEIIQGLVSACTIIAEAHDWKDVVEAIQSEDVAIGELQSLARTQSEVNGQNDFLLGPLRTAIRVMQLHEIMQIRFHNLLTSQQFVNSGTAPSTT